MCQAARENATEITVTVQLVEHATNGKKRPSQGQEGFVTHWLGIGIYNSYIYSVPCQGQTMFVD